MEGVVGLRRKTGISVSPMNGFSVDNLIHIMSFLDPPDILTLASCNRALSQIAERRIVWINALRRVTTRPGAAVFAHTFPMEEMTLLQLKHAATTPYRFLWAIECQGADGFLQPVARRVLSPPYPKDPPGATHDISPVVFTHSQVVPGGRFLLTQSSVYMLQLWDLGYRPGMMVDPVPIASVKIGVEVDHYIPSTFPTEDGEGLVVAIVSVAPGTTPPKATWDVFEIYPLATTPGSRRFNRIGSIPYAKPEKFAPFFHNSDLLIANLEDNTVFAWDFRNDRAVKWDVSTIVEEAETSQILLSGRDIILVDSARMSVWRIPPLETHAVFDGPGDLPVTDNTPLMLIPFPFDHDDRTFPYWVSWCCALSSPHGYPDLCMVAETTSDDISTASMYKIKNIKNAADDPSPDCVPALVTHIEMTDTAISSRAFFQSTDSNNLLLSIADVDGRVVYANVFSRPSVAREEATCTSSRLWTPSLDHGETLESMFCPFSARLCVVTESGEVEVCDFVAPL
ncbi:hypothetical protein PLICRDRAFT_42180 [Plicaturopsis crispa FD-325 SS-3]|nr:hypothetical protein PLICRDRAFT_42180 [Plicaturopsis crispa FD-325 SS-3]